MSRASPRVLRIIIALLLALTAVLLAAPGTLVPWNGIVRAAFPAHPWSLLPTLVSLILLLAAATMPRHDIERAAGKDHDYTAMAVGLLLLVEPLVHLMVLWWNASHPSLASSEAVLPGAAGIQSAGGWPGMARLLEVSFLAPVAEEAFFRGRLLPWLDCAWRKARWGRAAAMVVSSLAFALAHGDPMLAVIALPLGLLLAFVRLRSGDLSGCMLAHACHNSLFLFVGPGLISTPWMAPVLATGGAVLVSAAWLHHRHLHAPHRHLRATAVMVSALSLIVLSYPFYRSVQNVLWVRAAHQLVVHWAISTDALLDRFEEQRRHGRLDAVRREELYGLLCAQPCQNFVGGNPRQALMLAELDPERLAREVDAQQAYDRLLDLIETRPRERISAAVRALGLRFPADLVAVITVHPDVLPTWLPLDDPQDYCLAQLEVTSGHPRRMLLSELEHAYPGRIAGLLLRLPADHITSLDRRHLFGMYPDARARIAQLDADRQSAWLGASPP
jgi:membrane protease YdiL (CAAX protease family)